jgi:hypothetical protein
MLEKDFQTEEEAEAYLANNAHEFNSLENKICPLINSGCCGPRCACWEPAFVYGAASWHIAEAWCRSPYIRGEITVEQ